MDETLEKEFQDSEEEWAEIEKLKAIREKKDKKIISKFCANNDQADMLKILSLLEKYPGMPSHDKDVVFEFKKKYPNELTVQLIHSLLDVMDIYSQYLESGGNTND